jgi:predicted DNA-binding ArsR family transcriptional regulator
VEINFTCTLEEINELDKALKASRHYLREYAKSSTDKLEKDSVINVHNTLMSFSKKLNE